MKCRRGNSPHNMLVANTADKIKPKHVEHIDLLQEAPTDSDVETKFVVETLETCGQTLNMLSLTFM